MAQPLLKDAAWPALLDLPALGNRLLKPLVAHLEARQASQATQRLRQALTTAKPGRLANTLDLTLPAQKGQPARSITVRDDLLKTSKAHRLSRRLTFRGLDISIETDKGELRHWFDPHANKSGTTKMTLPYGYIRRTEGVDGDHVDCFVGPDEQAKNVYVVHQMKAPDFKVYDDKANLR